MSLARPGGARGPALVLTGLLAMVLLMLPGCPARPKPKAAAKAAFSDFTLSALDGSSVALSSFKGKILVLDFWASWCSVCELSVPEVMRLRDKFGPNGVVFLGIALDDKLDSVRAFQQEKSVSYPLLMGTHEVAKAYGVSVLPTVVVIDRSSQVVFRADGFEPDSGLAAVERVLNKLAGGKNAVR